MDLRFLHCFVTVVDVGSMAEAARRLDLAPTTVAQQVKALEDDIGARLLTRAGRTVRPTAIGTRIVERARQLLREARDLRSAASDTALPAGPLRLGATPTALMGLLPPWLRRWMDLHPRISIYIEPGTSAVLLGRVASGELDAAVIVHPLFDLPKTCSWQLLREEPLILLTPSDLAVTDPLATVGREPFIQYDRSVVAGRLADDYLRRHGVRPKVQFELDGIEHIGQLVAQGCGVSVLPDWPVIGPQAGTLRRWPLPAPVPVRRVGMVWLRSSVRAELVTSFLGLIDSAQVSGPTALPATATGAGKGAIGNSRPTNSPTAARPRP